MHKINVYSLLFNQTKTTAKRKVVSMIFNISFIKNKYTNKENNKTKENCACFSFWKLEFCRVVSTNQDL